MGKSRIFRITAFFIMFALLASTYSLAYVPKGGQWLSTQVNYYLDSSVSSYGFTTTSEYGAAQWYDYQNIYYSKTTNAEFAKVKVFAGDLNDDKWADAVNYEYNFFGQLVSCSDCDYDYGRIRINYPTLTPKGAFHAKKVLTHEFGHILGLEHSNVDPAIMLQGTLEYNTLQPDDIAGRNSIY